MPAERVLHLVPWIGWGGAQQVAVVLAEGARSAGHEVAVAAPSNSGLSWSGTRFELPAWERRWSALPATVATIDGLLRRFRPTVIHNHSVGLAPVLAAVSLGGRRTRVVTSVHGIDDADLAMSARLLRWSGLPVVSVSPHLARELASRHVPSDVIRNGVSRGPKPADRMEALDAFGIPIDAPLLVALGRLVPQKNTAAAVRALALLPMVRLLLLGDGPHRRDLAELAASIGVDDRLHLAGHRSDARRWLGAADAFIHLAHFEGYSLSVLEAAAAGVPMVLSRVVARTSGLTIDAVSIVDPGDDGAVAEAIRFVLDDRVGAAERARRAMASAASWCEDDMVEAYLARYGSALLSPPVGAP